MDWLRSICFSVFCTISTTYGAGAIADVPSEFTLLEETQFPELADELFIELQTCVEDKGFVNSVRVFPREGGALVEVWVTNRANFPINGLIVESRDPEARALGLDGPSIIEFEPLVPNERLRHTEFVPRLEGIFPQETEFTLGAQDIMALDSSALLKEIFRTRWPKITSAEKLFEVYSSVCEPVL